MKKLSVLLVVVFASVAMANAQDWAFGGRLGSGFQAVGQKYFYNNNYAEARLGMSWLYRGSVALDLSAMYVWNVANMDWTDEGYWFFDLGAGADLGGGNHYFFFGPQGMARLGYEFEGAPVRLSIDWSPSFGPGISSWPGGSEAVFNTRGMANFGLSCVYRF